jgi:C-terminal processing protease CtpA/Prc
MRTVISIVVFALFAMSCEKALFEEETLEVSEVAAFDYLWNEVNDKYSYFEVKNVDWNAVYNQYRPQVRDGISQDSLFRVMANMLNTLEDGHVNLQSHFNQSFFDIYALGQDQFDWRVITDNYLPSNYYVSGPFMHDFVDNGNIGYIRFPQFGGIVDQKNLDFVLSRYRNTKGLIVDLRENGGGVPRDMFNILERFVPRELTVYHTRIKNGPSHNDFSEKEAVVVSPAGSVRYTKPVVFLIDRGTYSAGSFTSIAAKAVPNITLMGDTTGGGLGLPNGGQLPNGWTYRFSVTQTLTLDGDPSYENGVPPDVRVDFDKSDLTKDEILDAAISFLQ